MTSSLRIRASIIMLLGVLLIPVATSSLRGLTHVLSCTSPVAARFDAPLPDQGAGPAPVLLDPTAVTRTRPGDPVATTTTTAPPSTTTIPQRPKGPTPVCGGITVDMKLSAPRPGVVRVDLPVRNAGRHRWRGTVKLRVGSKVFPVDLGSIPPGQTRTRSLEVQVDREVKRVTGELLLGP